MLFALGLWKLRIKIDRLFIDMLGIGFMILHADLGLAFILLFCSVVFFFLFVVNCLRTFLE